MKSSYLTSSGTSLQEDKKKIKDPKEFSTINCQV